MVGGDITSHRPTKMGRTIESTSSTFLLYVSEKSERRSSTEPRRVNDRLGNDERRSCYFFFLAAFFLAAGFLAAFFFAIILYLLRLVIRTRGSMVR